MRAIRTIPALLMTTLAIVLLIAPADAAPARNGTNNPGGIRPGVAASAPRPVQRPATANNNQRLHKCLGNTCGISRTINDAASSVYKRVKFW